MLKVSSSVTYRKLYPCYQLLKKSCLGVYSGIFALYLQCPSDESRVRSANIVFYILSILYILCAATVVCDLLEGIFGVSNKFICKNIIFIINCAVASCLYALLLQLQIELLSIYNRIAVVQQIVNACCDFTAQCIIVRINHSFIVYFIHLNLQRSTVVGSCGVKNFVL